MKKRKKENIFNVPNFLTALRVLISAVIVLLFIFDFNLILIMALFIVGMLTDTLDGNIARKFKLKTEFGRKFDMIADRALMGATALCFLFYYFLSNQSYAGIQVLLVISREIVASPVALMGLFKGNPTPQVRVIGKTVTVMQAISFPVVVIGSWLGFSWTIYFAIVTGIVGIISVKYYYRDMVLVKKLANR